MPKYHLSDLPLIDAGSGPTGPLQKIPLSDAGGLTHFGAWIFVLPPGSRSSIPHWHSSEDELIQILEGQATLIEDGNEHVLGPGAVVPILQALRGRMVLRTVRTSSFVCSSSAQEQQKMSRHTQPMASL